MYYTFDDTSHKLAFVKHLKLHSFFLTGEKKEKNVIYQ